MDIRKSFRFIRPLLCLSLFPALLWAYTASDYTNAGLQFYGSKDYPKAAAYFNAALGLDPNDLRALQGRANCYYLMGRDQEALADYERVQQASPSGPVSQFIDALKRKLSGPQTPAAPEGALPAAQSSLAASKPEKPAGLGLRLEPGYGLLDLKDFAADAKTGEVDAVQIQAGDPSYSYQSSVPTGTLSVAAEPVLKVGNSFELGLPFAILPLGTVTASASDSSGYSLSTSYALSAFMVGLTGRMVLGAGPVRPFLGGGPVFAPIGINSTAIQNLPGNSTVSSSGSFSQNAFGVQGQAGADFHVGEPFVVSLFAGYLFAQAEGFKGQVTTSGAGPTTTEKGSLGLVDTPNGRRLIFAQEGATPGGFQALKVDISGIMGGIHLAVFF